MFIELPITLINSKERELVGENVNEVPASMMVKLDSIQDIQENLDPNSCMMTLATGTSLEIPLSYSNLKKILLRTWETRAGIFFASYSSTNTDGINKKIEARCSVCGGTNIEPYGEEGTSDGAVTVKKCRDCGGIIHEPK
jgi:ribosomal protein S27E